MTVTEMKDLEAALRKYMAEKPGWQPVSVAMNRYLRAAIARGGKAA